MPASEHDDLMCLTLWSRNQKDEPQAVVSHESALVLHVLSDLLPDRIHLTVHPKVRKVPPAGSVLHKATLPEADVEERAGFRITTPLRTLLDVAEGGVIQEQLEKSISEALLRGLMRKKAIEAVAKDSEAIAIALGDKRLEIKDTNYSMASCIIRDAIDAKLIKPYTKGSESKKDANYVPFWT